MSGALANLDEKISKLEAATERCLEATRGANEATKALRLVEKEIRGLLGGREGPGRDSVAYRLVVESIAEHVAAGLELYKSSLQTAIDEAADSILAKLTVLSDAFFKGGDGQPPLNELIAERVDREVRRRISLIPGLRA